MAKLALPEFVTKLVDALVKVIDERVIQQIAKGSRAFASALQGLSNVSTPAPIAVRTGMPMAPPSRGNGPRR
jgi:hypothetical protein